MTATLRNRNSRFGLVASLLVPLALLGACGGGGKPATTQTGPGNSASTPPPAGKGLPACAAKDKGEKVKVGYVMLSTAGDGGYTYAHEQGRLHLQKTLDWVETTKVENVPEGAPAKAVFTDLIRKGYKIIFAAAYGYNDPAFEVGEEFKDAIILVNASSKTNNRNVTGFYGRSEEGRYLTGVLAGKLTKTNTVGFVAAYAVGPVLSNANAFARGVWSVNPTAKVKVVFTNTWYDPTLEAQAANSLLAAGADVLSQHQDSPATLQAATKAGKLFLGSESDTRKFGPNSYVSGHVHNWGPYLVDTVKQICDGTWTAAPARPGLKEDIVQLAPYGPMVPKDVQEYVDKVKQEIIDGKLIPFTGPIKDQDGKVRIPEGKSMSGAELDTIDYLMEGVDGRLPK